MLSLYCLIHVCSIFEPCLFSCLRCSTRACHDYLRSCLPAPKLLLVAFSSNSTCRGYRRRLLESRALELSYTLSGHRTTKNGFRTSKSRVRASAPILGMLPSYYCFTSHPLLVKMCTVHRLESRDAFITTVRLGHLLSTVVIHAKSI